MLRRNTQIYKKKWPSSWRCVFNSTVVNRKNKFLHSNPSPSLFHPPSQASTFNDRQKVHRNSLSEVVDNVQIKTAVLSLKLWVALFSTLVYVNKQTLGGNHFDEDNKHWNSKTPKTFFFYRKCLISHALYRLFAAPPEIDLSTELQSSVYAWSSSCRGVRDRNKKHKY